MTMQCPHCSFAIYNRRFPKCESCGAPLDEALVFSDKERRDLFEQDRLAAEAAWQEKQLAERRQKAANRAEDGAPFLGDY